jgi:hypothetical protein
MMRCLIPILVLIIAATASGTVVPPVPREIRSPHGRKVGDALAHGNSPGDLGEGNPDTPISAPLPDPWSAPWALVVTDFAAPSHGAIDWLGDARSHEERVGATPLAPTPVPAPSGFVLIGLGAATRLGRRRRVR